MVFDLENGNVGVLVPCVVLGDSTLIERVEVAECVLHTRTSFTSRAEINNTQVLRIPASEIMAGDTSNTSSAEYGGHHGI